MERIFLLKGLDCPNCSAKIEKEVGDLENVNSSSVNLMKQTLTIQTETFDNSIVEQIETIVHSHEPDVEVSEQKADTSVAPDKKEKTPVYSDDDKKLTIRLISGAVIYAVGMGLTLWTCIASCRTWCIDCCIYYSWLGCRMAGSKKYYQRTDF